jgi:hypothetical protein
MLSPFALPWRTVLSKAKKLRVNCAKHPGISLPSCKVNAGILRFAQNDGHFHGRLSP